MTSKKHNDPQIKTESAPIAKPLLRGHFHQAAFFYALGAWTVLLTCLETSRQVFAVLLYGLGLLGLLGVSSLYHRIHWKPNARTLMRRLDHSAIFLLIAGTFAPICLLGMNEYSGEKLLSIVWIVGVLGILQSLFWIQAPKWLSAVLYVAMGWLAGPYLTELESSLGLTNVVLLIVGGVIYTLGAVVYAVKKPNPFPSVFGYHEIFHILVIIAAILHFIVVARLIM